MGLTIFDKCAWCWESYDNCSCGKRDWLVEPRKVKPTVEIDPESLKDPVIVEFLDSFGKEFEKETNE